MIFVVRLGSQIDHIRTPTRFFLVRSYSISEPIEPSRSIEFDWVWFSSITEQFDWSRWDFSNAMETEYKHNYSQIFSWILFPLAKSVIYGVNFTLF